MFIDEFNNALSICVIKGGPLEVLGELELDVPLLEVVVVNLDLSLSPVAR